MSVRPLVLVCATVAFLSCSSPRKGGSLSPADALKSFQLSDDFEVQLFAAEPDVVDPVDMVFDEKGRAFVAEMLDLPDDPPKGKPARGRIRMLEDTDGDGKVDKSTIFAEHTLHASGLIPWDGGIIVPASPEILYFKDTNGDGKADVREVWFTGFYHGNPEAQITNPRFGVDNWIYFSNTGNEGTITSPKHPKHPPVQVRGFDFRYHPIKGIFEPVSGNAQFGSTFDDWGNRFISQNTTHLRHVVLPRQYLARAPLLEVGSVVHDVYGDHDRKMYPLTEPQEWRVIRTRLRQQRYDELKSGRVEHVAGYITGAAGGTVYNGDAWSDEYRGNIFTGDVSANLVRRDIVTQDGVTFKAVPASKTDTEKKEFLASTDQWFRPTCFANAPDGHLYMMDMQRETIETPLSIPEELRKNINFYSGDTLGRIYRITPKKPAVKRPLQVDLASAKPQDLVKLLEHMNGWHRETAHRLLLERQDNSVVADLKTMVRKSREAPARLRALYLVEGLGGLDQTLVESALNDADARVREHAIRLAEAFPQLEKSLVGMAKSEEPRIAMQLAMSLGNFKSAQAKAAVVDITARFANDRWIRTAALSSVADAPGPFFQALLAKGPKATPKDLLTQIGALFGARANGAEIQQFVTLLSQTSDAQAGLTGVSRGLKMAAARKLKAPGIEAALSRYLNDGVEAAWDVARHFEIPGLVERAAKEAVDGSLPAKKRVMAITALRGADFGRALPVLEKVFKANPAAEVQTAAILTLSSFDAPGVSKAVLANWSSYSPDARSKAIGALMAQKSRIPALLDALEGNQVPANALEVGARNRLLELSDAKLLDRARKVLEAQTGDRDKVVAGYQDVLSLRGNVDHGKQVFEDACAKCHMPRKQGGRVGPDLSGINMKSKEELLTAILNPSASIEPRFVNYLVTTKDGRMYDGVLANETPGAITLRGGSEEDVTLPRASIAEIRSSNISLMPEDIEKTVNKQGLADVIAYLRGGL